MSSILQNNQPKLITLPEFVTSEERSKLEKIAKTYLKKKILLPNPAGPNRFRAKIHDTKNCTSFISSIGERVISRLKLENYPVDEYLGWVVSLIQPGGFLQLHIDEFGHYNNNNRRHLRCNVMVSRQNDTYDPLIEQSTIHMPECSLWAFFASETQHGTQVITGSKPRIVFQFGFSTPPEYVLNDTKNKGQFWYG